MYGSYAPQGFAARGPHNIHQSLAAAETYVAGRSMSAFKNI